MTTNKVTWYFEPCDATTNSRIASLGDDVEECPDTCCIDWQGKPRKANLWRASESKASFICNSKKSRGLFFILYKQEGDGDIKQISTHRPINEQKENLFKHKVPIVRRRKTLIKGSSLLRRQQRKSKKISAN